MKKAVSICIFLILYYIYMNTLREIMIPFSSIVIPGILFLVMMVSIISSKGKIQIKNFWNVGLIFIWIIIYIYILINNYDLKKSVIDGGLIQLLTMIIFLTFANKENKDWIKTWVIATEIFVIIHALATIIFYFDNGLYTKYAYRFFSGDTLTSALSSYAKGYMSGLSSDFSTNGMILGIGIFFFFEQIHRLNRNKIKKGKLFYTIMLIITAYALILSSKRSPLIAAVLAISATYIISNSKNIIKNLIILVIGSSLIFGLYKILLPNIPGLSTITDKFVALEDSDAGVLNGRSGLWNLAINMFKQKPIIGIGYGSYSVYATQYDAITKSAHNYYLQVLSELGILGLILYIIAFTIGIVLGVKVINKLKEKNDDMLTYICISFEIQIFVLIYSMTSSALMYYNILIPYFLSLAATRTIYLIEQGKEKSKEQNN